MKYEDPKMEEYFMSLPSKVKAHIINSGAEIGSLGELILIGEHFKISYNTEDAIE